MHVSTSALRGAANLRLGDSMHHTSFDVGLASTAASGQSLRATPHFERLENINGAHHGRR